MAKILMQAADRQLLARAAAAPVGAKRSRPLRCLVLAGVLFPGWRSGRGLKKLCCAMFGIAMAFRWSGTALGFAR